MGNDKAKPYTLEDIAGERGGLMYPDTIRVLCGQEVFEANRVEATIHALATSEARALAAEAQVMVLREALEAVAKVGCMQREDAEEFWCRKDDSAHSIYCPRGIAAAALSLWKQKQGGGQ